MMNFLQNMAGPAAPQEFRETYRVYPVSFANKSNLESTDKILMPSSAFAVIARMHVTYPMMFQLVNPSTRMSTHCGVMEFSSEEGVCYMPQWMMNNLGITQGGYVSVLNVTLPKGSFVKLQPHQYAFTQLSNPRVVLEKTLRNFSCLTKGDTVLVKHAGKDYLLDVVEVKPSHAISIFETDVNVEFEPPKDMAKHEKKFKKAKAAAEAAKAASSVGIIDFTGQEASKDSKSSSSSPQKSNNNSDAASVASPTATSYFANRKGGQTINGRRRRRTLSSNSPAASPAKPTTTPSSTTISGGKTLANGNTMKREGRFDYIYDKAGRLIRRIPVREPEAVTKKAKTNSSTTTTTTTAAASEDRFARFRGKSGKVGK